MTRFEVKFQYADRFTNGRWNTQQCVVSACSEYDARKKCIELYGLGIDCDYRIVSVKEL